jgi:hypothetical protein
LKYYLKNDCNGWANFESVVAAESANGNIDSVMQSCSNSIPVATVNATGPLSFCDGGSATLTASGGATYSWSTGATGNSITVSNSGSYTAYVTQGICTIAATPVTVNVLPLPATPVLTQTGNVLSCGNIPGGVTANWVSNGQNVATGPFYNPAVGSGQVVVTFTDANGCISSSLPFSYTISDISSGFLANILTVSPNPVVDMLEVQLTPNEAGTYTFVIMDVTGKRIYTSKAYITSEYKKTIDFSPFSKGVYFLQVSTQNHTISYKIMN